MSNTFAVAVALALVDCASITMKQESAGKAVADKIALAYNSVKTEAEFHALFGNGVKTKGGAIVGAIGEETRKAIAKMAEAKQKKVLDILKTRLSEARRAFKAKITLNTGENVQAACKRIPKNTAAAKPDAGKVDVSTWVIPASATAEDIANALSVWIADHGLAAATGLAHKLPDFMPVSVKRERKAA